MTPHSAASERVKRRARADREPSYPCASQTGMRASAQPLPQGTVGDEVTRGSTSAGRRSSAASSDSSAPAEDSVGGDDEDL